MDIINKIFLIGKAIHHVLVLKWTAREGKRALPDAVSIGIRERVAITTPVAEWPRHIDGTKVRWCLGTAHINLKGNTHLFWSFWLTPSPDKGNIIKEISTFTCLGTRLAKVKEDR